MKEGSYYNGRRWVGGTAAVAHQIGQAGGVKEYEKKLLHDAIDRLIDDGSIEVVLPRLRVVNGGREA